MPLRSGFSIGLVAVAMVLTGQAAVRAATLSCDSFTYRLPPFDHSRVESLELDGRPVNVLVPPRYHDPARDGLRYPVLYLLHQTGWTSTTGANAWLANTDLIGFTAARADVIVVLPYVGVLPNAADWSSGSHHDETFIIATLIPEIDRRYRTLADGAHRAIAGASMGGVGATMLAARHPDMFVASAGFSGAASYSKKPLPEAFFAAATLAIDLGCSGSPAPTFGDPITNDVAWHDHSVTDLAVNLRGRTMYLGVGNGIPCPDDIGPAVGDMRGQAPEEIPAFVLEPLARAVTKPVDIALTKADVDHVAEFRSCGLHDSRSFEKSLHSFYPIMLTAFGRGDPSSFDYRRTDAAFSVWGWGFQADPKRAEEFLDVRNASCSGVTLKGSGTETVTTKPCFLPYQIVTIRGARESSIVATADGAGTLTFAVDLGSPHRYQQYTVEAGLADRLANGAYWRVRHVVLIA
jgi:S-formylglutathione hydrolase FrmB